MAGRSSSQMLGPCHYCFYVCIFGWQYVIMLCFSCFVGIQDPDWRTRLANFDAVFSPAASGQQQQQQAAAANTSTAEVDLATPVVQPVQSQCATPPHMTSDEFKKRYPEITCSVTINMGAQSITCHYADNKIFLVCTANFQIPGILSPDARPIFLYAGGTWISDSSKAGGVHVWCWCCACQILVSVCYLKDVGVVLVFI